jgi:hypothetical protein
MNAGVDGSMASWTGLATYNRLNDAEGCPDSGSISIVDFTDNFRQCFNTGFDRGTTYTFAYLYKAKSTEPQFSYCGIRAYTVSGCVAGQNLDASDVSSVESNGTNWVPGSVSWLVPSAAVSIEVVCAGVSGGGYFDHLVLRQGTDATY